ncbi:hypothetical protein ACN08P_06620 [Photobacterium leiognathi subsp. mandapamensis]|uniref:hypothetical protein n=1 Tax=Photobacterium leiognathi TaxID=553611 RepID=UPI0029817E2B|nr:hypothetical protein [Photobacterium leiognathi]
MRNLLYLFFIISFPSFAITVNDSSAKAQLMKAKKQYENQMNRCHLLESRELTPIKDSWLKSLPSERKQIVLQELNEKALERCVMTREKNFTYQLMDYTAKTGDKLFLNSWLILKSAMYNDSNDVLLTDNEQKNFKRLSAMPKYYYPFNIKAIS